MATKLEVKIEIINIFKTALFPFFAKTYVNFT